MNPIKYLLCISLGGLLMLSTAQAQKMAVPYYSAGQVKFYDLSTNPATLLGTLNTTVGGTTYKPNGVTFFGTDLFVAYDEPSSDGFLHFKGVSVSGGAVSFSSAVKITTGTVTTEIVADASGTLYVGCAFGPTNRGVKKFVRSGSGTYSASTNLTMPAVSNSQWYSGIGGLAFDASGNLFATDLSDNRVLKWAAATGTPAEFKCTSSCAFGPAASANLFAQPEGLVQDATGNLWVANNNDGATNTPNTAGSLVRINASLVSTSGGAINSGNTTIYSTAAAKFGGMSKVGSDFYVNDQGNSKVWKLNTTTGALTDVGVSATYPGNGQVADVPSAVFPAVTVSNPTVSVLPSSAVITAGQSVTLTAAGCATGNTYLWNTGDATAQIIKSPGSTITYIAYCKNGATQSSGLSTQITVNPPPATGITATGSLNVTSSLQTGSPRARTFTYHAPSAAPACNLPLLIVLHGDGGTGAGIMNYTNFNALGDAQGFITVYPDALTTDGSLQWNKYADNVGGFGGSTPADANAPDDVQFMADLIDYLHKKFGINRRKVYVSGHSGGGFMAYSLAIADLTKSKIAGIAPVAASLWGEDAYLTTQFGASAFVKKPVLHIHATTDNVVPFPDLSGWIWPESSFGNSTCGTSTKTTTALATDIDQHSFCGSLTPVVLIGLKRAGLGHNWPTTSNSGYNTETEIWNFLNPYSSAAMLVAGPTVFPLSATIATGGSVGLSATGCGTFGYKWSDGQTGSSVSVSPLISTNYGVGCYTDNNCLSQSSSNTSKITVTSGSTVGNPIISPTSATVNTGQLVTLTASGCATGNTYLWNTGATSAGIIFLPPFTATYTAYCKNGAAQSSGTSAVVTVLPAPSVSPASPTITAGQSVTLTASGCASGNTYSWNPGNPNATTASIVRSPTATTTAYSVYCVGSTGVASGGTQVIVTVSTGPTAPVVDDHIKTDQFGYLPSAQKIAVISSPDPTVSQYNQSSPFTPGSSYQLRRVADDVSVFSAAPVAWNGGATHAQSGDKVWWFDFSSVTTPGSYYVYDVGNNKRSYSFDINTSVYETPARQALAALKMQRCGTARFGQLGSKIWSDVACHVGSLQDTQCRDVSDPTNATKARDLSGGWHDAGDFNKYSLYASEALHNLLNAYQENPTAWSATAGSLPGILDEAKYELDWLLKMQDTDGGVRCKVSIQGFGASSPPSNDTRQRFYGGKSTLTTLAVSSVLAHAASVFGSVEATYSTALKTAAQNAWNWAAANPNVIFNNTPFLVGGGGSYNPDDGIYGDASSNYYRATSYKTVAAAYLFNAFGATAGAAYKTNFESLYASTNQMTWTAGSDTYFPDWQVVLDALLTYANHPDATTSHATAIRNKFTALVTTSTKLLPAYTNSTDAYRAYLNYYPWNSNQQKAQIGIQMQTLRASNLSPASNTALQNASLGFMNYLHGLNPNAKCYLSQMNTLGADNSQNEVYHGWFWDGTVFDNALTSSIGPFPGLLIGGPNQDYSGTVSPPSGQPAQKAYKDWNTDYPDASYEITEIGIYTQAAYIRLASRFLGSSTCALAAGTAASVQSGNWTDPATWQCGTIPTATSLTQIKAGHIVTINGVAYSNRVQFETAAKVIYTPAGRLVLGQ